jgi:hypothetical protein
MPNPFTSNAKPFGKFGEGVTKRVRMLETKAPLKIATVINDEPAVMIVQGRNAGSSYEWRVSKALDNMKVQYTYQYTVQGGSSRRGGQVIDFLLDTPMPTMLDVKGRYWHTGVHEDEMQSYELKRLLPWATYLAMWDEVCTSIQTAETFLRQKINV